MCICHLPCRNLKPSLSGEQVRKSSVPKDEPLPGTCKAATLRHAGSFRIYLLCVGPPLQAAGRHAAHYHCVVCSATIARKTDMVSHLKRHINKGETEASYSGSSDLLAEEEPGEKRCPFLLSVPEPQN